MPFGQVGLLETLIGFLRASRLEVIAFYREPTNPSGVGIVKD